MGPQGEADRIQGSPKYRALARETIVDVLERETARHGPGRRALASAREVLHRVAALYLGEPDYERVGRDLERCADASAREAVCRQILTRHVSTRERLPILSELYRELFARTGVPRSLADLAAACNPFAYPWMGLPHEVRYDAYDINANLVRLVDLYFRVEGVAGRAIHRDVLCRPPTERVDVALLMKMYHCLEHRRRGAGWELVSAVPARVVVVTFPSRNMRGRSTDIAGNYRDGITHSCAAKGWSCEEMAFPGEIVLLVTKGDT